MPLGIFRRRWHYRGGQHADDGVFDQITTSFVRYISGSRQTMRLKVEHLIAEHAGLITLTSRRQAADFV